MIYELSLFGSLAATLALIAGAGVIWACIRAIAQYVYHREDEREFKEYCRRYVEREYASVEAIDSLVRRELDEMTKVMERTR